MLAAWAAAAGSFLRPVSRWLAAAERAKPPLQHLVPGRWVEQRLDWSAVVHRSEWGYPGGPASAVESPSAQPHGVLKREIKLVDTRVHCGEKYLRGRGLGSHSYEDPETRLHCPSRGRPEEADL